MSDRNTSDKKSDDIEKSMTGEKLRWKPSPEEIRKIIHEHKIWLESGGEKGQRAELYYTDLSKADLFNADLREARIWETYLYEANLRDADFTDSEGILPKYLAGADLTGAKFPEDVARFDGIKTVETLTRNARRIFWLILLVIAYSWLMLANTGDARLLSSMPLLPIQSMAFRIPTFWFFAVLPGVLFLLYIGFHLSLQRNWEAVAELPAMFPDGSPVDRKIYPWFVNRLARPQVRLVHGERPPLMKIQNAVSIILTRWIVPCTIAWFWIRYLTRHDWTLSAVHIGLSALAVILSFFFYFLGRRTLRGQVLKGSNIFVRAMYLVIAAAFFTAVSFGTIKGVPPGYVDDEYSLIPNIAWNLGYNVFADFSHEDVSFKPSGWGGYDSQVPQVRGADLSGFDLPYARGEGAFLAGADMTGVNLKDAVLDSADLRQAVMYGANLERVRLTGANLRGADLTEAELNDADVNGADFQDVIGLTLSELYSAKNWLYAQYGEAVLKSLNLPPDHNEKIKNKDMSNYRLQGANLQGAVLAGFDLTGADLRASDLSGADLTGTNLFLTDLRGVIGLDRNMLQKALNWLFALYDENILVRFGLPANHNELAVKKDFRGYNLKGINLTAANLKNANLRQVDMSGAVLIQVNLQDADLYAVNLTGADLTGANFKGTILLDTDIRGANLTGVDNLTLDQIRWAIYDSTTVFPDSVREQALTRLIGK